MNSFQASRLGFAPKKAASAASGTGDAGMHLNAAVAAHKKGDHHGAKKHALAAVNLLHRMASAPAAPSAPAMPDPAAAGVPSGS